MRLFSKGFFWQFAGGFALGAIGLVTLQPTQAGLPADYAAPMASAAQ